MESVNKKSLYEVTEVELVYRSKVKASERLQITTSHDAARLLQKTWDAEKIEFVEQFKILLLNKSNKVLGLVEISSGGVTGTVADCKLIFVAALKANACNIIISHNHPSGNFKPSKPDELLTQKIREGAKLLDINLHDHIIITRDSYYSFADEGLLNV